MKSSRRNNSTIIARSTTLFCAIVANFAVGLTVTAAEPSAKTTLKTEHFDRDPAWDAVNNRVKIEKPVHVIQDFGYSVTNHVGGTSAGEIGGRVQRCNTNILGVGIEGATSSSPKFEARAASSDPKAAHRLGKTALRIAPDGKSHTWKIEYDPGAEGGRGRLTVWLDDHQDSFTLPPELRKAGATFDRFGLFVHEGGGRASRVYLDDLEYTAAGP